MRAPMHVYSSRAVNHVARCCRWVFKIDMPAKDRIFLVDALADVEHRLAFGTSERLQLGSLVGAFTVAREGIVAAAL